ncbi:MAG: hypothetical protein R2874_16840 [Desulfobacterales bacterium]
MATIAPRGSFMMEQIDLMAAEIREKTGNEVGIKLTTVAFREMRQRF